MIFMIRQAIVEFQEVFGANIQFLFHQHVIQWAEKIQKRIYKINPYFSGDIFNQLDSRLDEIIR